MGKESHSRSELLRIESIEAMRRYRDRLRYKGETVALVPTMGNLHEGHLDLVRAAQKSADRVIVSIFVNPIQFGENEDFDAYPRTLDEDQKKLEALGVSAIFTPSALALYPDGAQKCFVVPSTIQNELCGASRVGHFNGVATVVTKLFNIIEPTTAYFGEKDYQQLAIIREMVSALNMNIEIVGVPTKRDARGLALSSRNGYLTADEQQRAPELYQTLLMIKNAIKSAEKDHQTIINEGIEQLENLGWRVEYLTIREAEGLSIPDELIGKDSSQSLIILAAAYLGKTRLIDNLKVDDK